MPNKKLKRVTIAQARRLRPHQPRKGQKPFVPTDEQRRMVAILAAKGNPPSTIAAILSGPDGTLGISQHTVEKHFRFELDYGKQQATGRIHGVIFDMAVGRDAELDKQTGRVVKPALVPNLGAAAKYLEIVGDHVPTQALRHGDSKGDPLQMNAPPLVIFLPPNGRETGANGDPAWVEQELKRRLEADGKKAKANGHDSH